jgi:hypothetical protein
VRSRHGLVLLCSVWLAACERSTVTQTPERERAASVPATPEQNNEHVMAYGERTIHVYADPSLAVEVARLFALFEDLAAEQVPLDRTTRLPIGWTTLSFAAEGDRLIVEEPDYANQPELHTRRDISVSLATLARQRAVLENAGVAGEPIGFDQHVLTIAGVLELDEVLLLRVESPGGRLTGWRLSPTEGIAEDSEIESLPVYAILEARPALLDAMLLPAGYMAFYSGNTITTIVNERDEVVWDWNLSPAELERDGDERGPQPLLEPLPRG